MNTTQRPLGAGTTDDRLMELAQQGDQTAFGVLVLRYTTLVEHTARRIVKTAAEDVAQQLAAGTENRRRPGNKPIAYAKDQTFVTSWAAHRPHQHAAAPDCRSQPARAHGPESEREPPAQHQRLSANGLAVKGAIWSTARR